MAKYDLIVKYLQEFESSLKEQRQVGLTFPVYGGPFILQSTISGGDQFIAFEMLLKEGEIFTVLQNYSQLNFAVVSCPKTNPEEPVRKIGFRVFTDSEQPAERDEQNPEESQ